jgi:antitoxin (DNA-binding transcriptional repressor) of toxin-antitoxin stability system
MDTQTASIRQLRTDFRSIKKKIEQYGEVLITDHGEPAYILKSVPIKKQRNPSLPDYYARLVKRQPESLSPEKTQEFWDEERR